MMWRVLMAAAVLTVGGCEGMNRNSGEAAPVASNDAGARTFSGSIISLRPTVSTMLISKEEQVGRERFPNQIVVKYDANTKFLIDGRPVTLVRPVRAAGTRAAYGTGIRARVRGRRPARTRGQGPGLSAVAHRSRAPET